VASKLADLSVEQLQEALDQAELWSVHGYSAASRAYWQGMRDTLRVVLGVTTDPPMMTADDAAACTILRRTARG